MTNEAIFRAISLFKTTKIIHFLSICESPIEKRFLLCLINYFETNLIDNYQIGYEYDYLETEVILEEIKSRPTAAILKHQYTPYSIRLSHPLFSWSIIPQKTINIDENKYRVDFLVVINKINGEVTNVCIECDGHNYHHRTESQINKDNTRDINLASKGYVTFHLTSSQILDLKFDETIGQLVSKINGYANYKETREEALRTKEVLPTLVDEYSKAVGLSNQEKNQLLTDLRSKHG
jgi:very-short-patch-repair endonuclease